MKKTHLKRPVFEAISACQEKKAEHIVVLELEPESGAFTDYFVVCSGTNPRQVQAISDEVEERLDKAGMRPAHVEGYKQAEWVLLDYVDFVVHIFSEKARSYYDLERLWKSAKRLEPGDLTAVATRKKRAPARPLRKKRA
jgi:ribosome-associated protein